jgi:hypothetical protein
MAKYGYICYFVFTQEFNMSPDQQQAWNANFDKLAKKHGFKRDFSGSPWGVDYHGVAVLESDKMLDEWEPFISEVLQTGKVVSTTTTVVSLTQ